MRKLLILAALLGGAVPAIAQTETDSTEPESKFEDSVVVTAALEKQPANRVTAAVTVIDGGEIEARQSTGVVELLRAVPGLTVMQSGGPGKVASLFTRGSESDHTLALWNGIELNNPFFGGFDWALLPTDGVERIEVVRGPFSAVHGSDALGGVVQILTGGRKGGSLRLEAGERGYGRAAVDAGWSTSAVEVDLTGHLRRGDGEVENDSFESEEMALSARWLAVEGLSLSLVARAHDSDNGIPFSGGTPSPEREIAWRERQLAMPVLYSRGPWELDGRLSQVSYTTTFRDPLDAFGFTDAVTDSSSNRLRLSATRRFGSGSWIAFGSEHEQLEVDDRSVFGVNLDGARQETTSVFAQVAHDLGPLRIDLGVRHDDNDAFGERTTPKLGVLMPLGETTRVRASWGEGFRAPSIGELFYPFSGNAELEPEESESWEVGIEYEAGSWQAGLTHFDNEFVNLIDFDFVTFSNRNVGRAASSGFEIWSRYVGRLFSVSANVTFLESEDLATGEALLRRPEESASLVVIASPGAWATSFTASFVGDRVDVDPVSFARTDLGSHVRLDVAARLEKWSQLQPFARIENLADRDYQEVAGYPAPGRRVIAGLLSSWQ